MGKITGLERTEDLQEKVLLLYDAVAQLIAEGEDMTSIKVSLITQRAGIGKGTAYEYFDSKEDIIVCAITHLLKKVTEEIHCRLMALDTFEDRMKAMLDMTEEKLEEQQCFLQFVHLMTDTSSLSQLLREKIRKDRIENYLPVSTLKWILKEAIQKGEVRSDLPMDYMVYAVFLRMITYMTFLSMENDYGLPGEESSNGDSSAGKRSDSKGSTVKCEHPHDMRPFIYRGLVEEFAPR